jgi:glycine cleavage system H protein
MIPTDCYYTKEHEWVRVEDATLVVIGITDFAQDQLGDVIYVNLPENGSEINQSAQMGEAESVKAVSDLFSPVTGTVVEVNGNLQDAPELVNRDPYGDGWMLKVELSSVEQLANLLSADQYGKYLDSGEH